VRPLITALVAILALGVVLVPGLVGMAQTAPPVTFLETFDFEPGAPVHYVPPGWDVSVVAHENETIEPMWANHGPNCEPPDDTWPGGTPNGVHNHFISLEPQTTFDCSNHIMTSMNAGYGAVYLTPPAMLDFRNGTATLEWDMSTERTSSRDWVDIMILPFDNLMALNMVDFHTPTDGIQVELQGGGNVFAAHTFLPAFSSACGPLSYAKSASIYYCGLPFDGYHQWDMIQQLYGLHTSAARRDHFIIELSKTHLRMGFRPASAVGSPFHPYFYWIDSDIPGGLRFDEGVVQLNQRAYNPLKPCGPGVGDAGASTVGWQGSCRAATWHWDNVAISPATPFTIIPGARKVQSGGSVTFPLPAPANSFLKAAGSRGTEYSLNGTAWQRLPVVGPEGPVEAGDSFWTAVPAGTQTVRFRNGSVQDVYLYSRTPRDAIPIPTPLPATATAIATRTPVSTPTATPTAFVPPTATSTLPPATATAVAAATATAVVAATDTPTPTPEPPVDKPLTPTVMPTTFECYARAVERQDGVDTEILVLQPSTYCRP
jgi:hypothetical protein